MIPRGISRARLCLWVSKGVGHLGQHAPDKRRKLVRLNVGGGDVDPVMVSKQVISGWPAGLPASIAAMISSCVNPNSERADLSLGVVPLRLHSSSWNSMAPRYLT
jgi:hypothetical protein